METEKIEVKRFDLKIESKIYKALKKFFDEADNPVSEQKAIETKDLFKIDVSNVCMIEPLSEEAKRVISKFIEDEEENRNLPKLNYDNGYGTGSKFSSEYLKKIINLLELSGDAVKTLVSRDYPGTFENEHFRIILAPRVGGD
jgi:hypothetical protein